MDKNSIEEVRAFNRAYTVFMGLLNKSFLKSEYTLVETRVMHAALSKEGISPYEIVALLNIDKSYLSRIVTNLVRRKVLSKTKSKTDRRSVCLSITAFGKKEFTKLAEASNVQVAQLLSDLDLDKRDQLVKNMSEIRRILEGR